MPSLRPTIALLRVVSKLTNPQPPFVF
jgi:hypothetical protein